VRDQLLTLVVNGSGYVALVWRGHQGDLIVFSASANEPNYATVRSEGTRFGAFDFEPVGGPPDEFTVWLKHEYVKRRTVVQPGHANRKITAKKCFVNPGADQETLFEIKCLPYVGPGKAHREHLSSAVSRLCCRSRKIPGD